MTRHEIVADAFFTALKSLPRPERDAVLVRIARDKSLARDFNDLALITERNSQPSRPFRQYLAEKKRRKP